MNKWNELRRWVSDYPNSGILTGVQVMIQMDRIASYPDEDAGSIEWAIRQIRNGQKVVWVGKQQTFKLSPGGWTEGFNLNKNEFLGVQDNTRIPFNGWTIVEKKPIRPIWSEL